MRAGMDEATGKIVTGWDHCQMVIRRALTTRPGALVLRRRIGSRVPLLQDENMTAEAVIRLYVAIAEALAPSNPNWGEPGFRLRSIRLVGLNSAGQIGLVLTGDYYPNGHLGDYSVKETGSTTLPVREAA
ncbi:MAG TPA: baseplate assembly protein [Rhabdaerophilum sp.]|nr:baseplate assembly protein [Rhabdaerophilum sp.]